MVNDQQVAAQVLAVQVLAVSVAVDPVSNDTLSVVILAGGQSRRMGQDKALLSVRQGQSLLGKTVQTAWQVTPRVGVVTPWPERYRSLLADVRSPTHPIRPPFSVELIQESLPADTSNLQGPLAGFVKGWEALPSTWCLLLACDLPYLESSILRDWWQQLAAQSDSLTVASLVPGKDWRPKRLSDASGVAPPTVHKGWEPPTVHKGWEPPTVHKGWEPLCGFYHRRGLPGLKRYLASGGRSFQGWLANVPVAPFYGVPKKMLFNCNTPEDWAKVRFQ